MSDKSAIEWVEWVSMFANRNDLAHVYAKLLRNLDYDDPDWRYLNEAIIARWSESGLRYIKTKAWKIAESLKP